MKLEWAVLSGIAVTIRVLEAYKALSHLPIILRFSANLDVPGTESKNDGILSVRLVALRSIVKSRDRRYNGSWLQGGLERMNEDGSIRVDTRFGQRLGSYLSCRPRHPSGLHSQPCIPLPTPPTSGVTMHIDWNAWKEIRDLTLWANGYFVFYESEPTPSLMDKPYSTALSCRVIEGAVMDEVILPRASGQVTPANVCVEELNERFLRYRRQQ